MEERPGREGEEDSEFRHLRLHPAWYSFIRHCESLQFGEIERLKIHQGLPVLAEEVRRKINFMKGE